MTHEHRTPLTPRVSPSGAAHHSNSSGVALPAVVQAPKTGIENQVESGLMNEESQRDYPATQRFIIPPGERHDKSSPEDVRPFQLKESGGVIQRMISEAPPETNDIEALEKYIYGTSINNRAQTFEYAAMESEMGISRFELLKTALKEKDPVTAHRLIKEIITLINAEETRRPSHPNKVWNKDETDVAKKDEAPYTISKTPESIKWANEARKIILAERIVGKDDKFMLGVMVLPDGQLIVATSGSRTKISLVIAPALLSKGFKLFGDIVYDSGDISQKDVHAYKQAAEKGVKAHAGSLGYEDKKIVKLRKDEEKDNIGSFPANCAAAVALSIAQTVSPKSFSEGGRLGLAEVFISTNEHSEVLIYNITKGGGERFTMKDEDVPSCHVCQIQLGDIATNIVKMERKGIVEHLKYSIDKRFAEIKSLKTEIEKYEKEAKERESQRKLSELIKGLSDKQEEMGKNLSSIEKALSNNRRTLKELAAELESANTQMNTLKNANKDKASERDMENQILHNIKQLEKDIKKSKETIGRLEKDEKELESAASFWHAPLYTSWYSKLEELKKQATFRQATKSDIDNRLTNELTSKRKELSDLEDQQKKSDPERAKGSFEILDKEIKKNNVEINRLPREIKKLGEDIDQAKNEGQQLSAEYNELKNEFSVLNKKIEELTQQLNPLAQIEYNERRSRQLIKQNERKVEEAGTEIKRMAMTANIYKGNI